MADEEQEFEEPTEQLSQFLDKVQNELEMIVYDTYRNIGPELSELLSSVWKELAENFDEAKKDLLDIKQEDLFDVGLTGNGLKLKLKGFELAVANRLKKPILRWINIILGSLSKILPVLEPIKEYKEILEELQI